MFSTLTWNTRIPVLATARLILVPSLSLAGCNRIPYISSRRATSKSWKSDSAGVCPLTQEKEKRKARGVQFPGCIHLQLSSFLGGNKRCFMAKRGAVRSDDTQSPIGQNPSFTAGTKALLPGEQSSESLSGTWRAFWRLRVSSKVM